MNTKLDQWIVYSYSAYIQFFSIYLFSTVMYVFLPLLLSKIFEKFLLLPADLLVDQA